MNIAEYTIRKAVVAWMVTLLVLVGGWLSYERLGRFEDPEFVIRQAVVVTAYPGASPAQVAEEITDLIEGAVQQMQEVEEITSVSRAGESLVKVEARLAFSRTQAELDQVWDKLRSKIAEAARALPPGAAEPVVKSDFGDVFALFYALTGDGYSPRQLWDYADLLRRELVLVPGVARVALLGERKEAIYVEVSSARAAQLGVPLDRIHASLRAQNLIAPAGAVGAGPLRLQIQPADDVVSVEALGQLVVAGDANSGLLRLRDVADIRREYVDPPVALMRHDGRPAIGLGISNVQGGNVVEMGDAVKRRLAELEGQRPIGMELNVVSFQSDSVRAAVSGFVDNLVAAVVIVVVVLLLFMGLRSGLIIGAVLVLTVAGTLIAMLMDGIAMQRISLGALIIALGMLVDNAIVVTDGILVRLQKGEPVAAAAGAVVRATVWPLLGGTVVGILAFSAIGLSPSDMGEYAGSLFWVILYSMLLSWLFAITLTPLLCAAFLKVKVQAVDRESRLLRAYRRLLQGVLAHRAASGIALAGLLAAGVVAFGHVPAGFMPDSARPQFVVDLTLPQGTDIHATAAVVGQAEAKVRAAPGVTHVSSFIGQGGLRFTIVDAAMICTVAFQIDGMVHAIPTIHWREGDHLYIHGAKASRMLKALTEGEACVTIALADGLVLARSAMHHSMNYRSVVIYGRFELVTDPAHKLGSLCAFIDGLYPGRWDTLRPITNKELNATGLLRIALSEAAAKVRDWGVKDDAKDLDWPVWAGVIPLHTVAGEPMTEADSVGQTVPPTRFG